MASGDHALRNILISYNHSNQAFTDIRGALQSFKDLRPHKKPFTYGNGQVKSLVCLEGTIPISYKSKSYNIPIIIWCHETHPQNAPMVFVQPTATMNIKPGKHVDRSGSVTIPYLTDWKQGQTDLHTLITVLCMVFGESPPVFAKPKNQQPQQPAQAIAAQPPPVAQPPYPVSSGMPTPGQPYSGTTAPVGYPQPPAYPATNSGYSASTTTNTATPQGYNPYGPPSQAPYPAANTTATAIGGYPGMYGQGAGYGTGMPYPTPASSTTAYPGQTGGGYPPTTTPYSTTGGYPSYANPAVSTTVAASEPTAMERQKSFGLSDEEIKQSLLSDVEDKMRRRLKDIFSTHKAEMDVLKKTQQELTAGREKLEALSKTVDTETTECQTTSSILSSTIPELKAEIEKRDSESDLSPDEAIETTAPLYRQLIQSFAEEQAIEDTLYILGDALRRETIGIELYLKKVRDLSRKQFMLRALMQKCREKAGLAPIYS